MNHSIFKHSKKGGLLAIVENRTYNQG